MTAEDIASRLGGSDALGRRIEGELDLVNLVREGLPVSALETAIRRGVLSRAEAERLVIPRRTLSHRKRRGEPLTTDESDKLARVVRVAALAEETFQDEEKAHGWLRDPNRALGGERPLDLLETEGGARLVEQVLGRIAHGVFS
jgi:putative toxin-antitoxin system antitoxin component (TIGR02293 family)